MRLGDDRERGRAALRQAARRRARARGRADAGAAVRDPAARPARRRGREGRAPRARRVGPRRRRRRCSTPTAARSARPSCATTSTSAASASTSSRPRAASCSSRWSPHFDVVAENFKAGHDGPHGPRLRRRSRPRIPRAIYVSISGFGNTVDDAVRDWPAYASIVEAMSGIYDYRASRRAAGHDPGRRARRHQLRRSSA